jgi:hypothetical protein
LSIIHTHFGPAKASRVYFFYHCHGAIKKLIIEKSPRNDVKISFGIFMEKCNRGLDTSGCIRITPESVVLAKPVVEPQDVLEKVSVVSAHGLCRT